MNVPLGDFEENDLQLMKEREAKLAALRETLDAAIKRGGSHTEAEVRAAIRRRLAQSTIER